MVKPGSTGAAVPDQILRKRDETAAALVEQDSRALRSLSLSKASFLAEESLRDLPDTVTENDRAELERVAASLRALAERYEATRGT
jgi:hypothetical protein